MSPLSPAITILAYTLAGLIITGTGLAGLVGLWFVRERLLLLQASRVEAERRAHVMVITNSGHTWVRDTAHKAHYHNLTLDPRIYANGQATDPTELELRAWEIVNGPKRITQAAGLLPEPAAQPLDLLSVLDNEQRVLIKGVSNAGKTNLLRWIASRRMNYSTILVIDPHASPDKWAGCKVVGVGSNHNEIAIALDKLIDLMVERYQDIAKGTVREGEHSKLTIIVDEWMSIAYECVNAKRVMVRLLTESRKAAFSVYVGSHSDRVASLGLDGKGDLRDGFCLVRLSLINGVRQATIDYGNGELPVTLPGAFVANVGQIIDTDDFIDLEPEPSPAEAHILNLHDQGASYNEIARQVYGHSGGKQVNRIKQTLGKFN